MRNYCLNKLGFDRDKATEMAGEAGRYHLKRWKEKVGLATEDD